MKEGRCIDTSKRDKTGAVDINLHYWKILLEKLYHKLKLHSSSNVDGAGYNIVFSNNNNIQK